jgi:hypothetical protein
VYWSGHDISAVPCARFSRTGKHRYAQGNQYPFHFGGRQIKDFLDVFHAKLDPGAVVIFIDNHYVEGNSHPITRTDAGGNTYQTRELPDGSQHEVLKNFPGDHELKDSIQDYSSDVEIKRLTYYWMLRYRVTMADVGSRLPEDGERHFTI